MERAGKVAGLAGFVLAVLVAGAAAAPHTPVGLWKTIDDDGHTEKSLVRIVDTGGVLSGAIEALLDPRTRPDETCHECPDERKDRPLVGLSIMRNVRQDVDDATLWSGGEILDPKNGKSYRVRLRPVADGTRLEVRGYIGTPLIGRTQTWVRVE